MSATLLSSFASIAVLLGVGGVMCVVTDCDRLRRCARVDWFGGGNSVKTLVLMLKDLNGLSVYLLLVV